MLAPLLKMMSDGQFHSGEELGRALGVSRAAVWKTLKRLEDDGYPLQRVRGKGYRVPQGASMLDLSAIQAAAEASGDPIGWQLLDAVDSTNAELMRQLAGSGAGGGIRICIAEQQTSGKGRRGRAWVSPYAQNIYLSVAAPFSEGAQKLEGLSLLVGLVLVESLEAVGFRDVGLKWPNDILLDGRKLAGILVEIAGDLTSDCVAVIGVGVNVLMTAEGGIDQAWTSLLLSRQRGALDRNALIGEFLRRLLAALERFRREGFQPFVDSWHRYHLWQGREVRVQAGDNSWTGKAMGVDARGALRLQTAAGEMLLHGGEVTLRLNDDS
ncbi:biotin--[acetyl-CoA-carboxylase] ligase [Halopseudomonas formosensis]|uniref:Bifunctional ligase/repressor BirA n=1 Tax=Halopseudomonas formosensis TaxID=1002526 RepID=A0ABU5C1B5_9GAMM|nr:biotin--[acetyl-CoA-carboxylase] ligase [Halopseudomonas formosensis]MDX9688834.1 biotin--[acetyl-CoA-carboxylase] ligase [Halopseudomonas formosensis]